MISRHDDEAVLDRVRTYQASESYHKARRKRSVWVKPLFAEAKDWQGLRRCRWRRLWRVNVQVLWTAGGRTSSDSWRGAGGDAAPSRPRRGCIWTSHRLSASRVEPLGRRGAP
jgi:hypothetical protein